MSVDGIQHLGSNMTGSVVSLNMGSWSSRVNLWKMEV